MTYYHRSTHRDSERGKEGCYKLQCFNSLILNFGVMNFARCLQRVISNGYKR